MLRSRRCREGEVGKHGHGAIVGGGVSQFAVGIEAPGKDTVSDPDVHEVIARVLLTTVRFVPANGAIQATHGAHAAARSPFSAFLAAAA